MHMRIASAKGNYFHQLTWFSSQQLAGSHRTPKILGFHPLSDPQLLRNQERLHPQFRFAPVQMSGEELESKNMCSVHTRMVEKFTGLPRWMGAPCTRGYLLVTSTAVIASSNVY